MRKLKIVYDLSMTTGDEYILPADELIGQNSQIDVVINNQYVVVAGKNHLGLYDLLTGTFLDDIKLKKKKMKLICLLS